MLKRNKHAKTEKIAYAVLSVILAMGAGCSAYGAEIDASIETEVDLYLDDIAGTAELASPPSPPGNNYTPSWSGANEITEETTATSPVYTSTEADQDALLVKSLNKSLKTSPLQFTVEECTLKSDIISGTAAYKKSSGKWSFNLKADTGGTKLQKLKYGRDFAVIEGSYNAEKATVQIEGKGNYTGTAVISSVQTK